MRLLQLHGVDEFSLVEYHGKDIPRYAILSHTWGMDHQEVSYQGLREGTGKNKIGYRKLLAPASVEFFSAEGHQIGDEHSLQQTINETTGMAIEALRGRPLPLFDVDERMSFAKSRETKREEDAAYSLLGLFDIHMALLYGKGRDKAFGFGKRFKRP